MNFIIPIFFFLSACVSKGTLNKADLNGFDFRLFQHTPAWPLAKAAKDENITGIKNAITRNKAILNFREPAFGQTVLQLAVDNQKYKSVEILLELGADPNIQDTYNGSSPVMEAAKLNNEYMGGPDPRYLKILLKYGGNPNARENTPRRSGNLTRHTPLLNACFSGVFEYIKILVEAGANVNYVGKHGENALYAAIVARNPDMVMYLLKKGANFRRPMAIYRAFNFGGMQEKQKYLYIADALKSWKFPVASAKYQKEIQIIDFLKMNGIDFGKSQTN